MDYREKLETFIGELNEMLSDDLLFPDKRTGRFELTIKEGLIGGENGETYDAVAIYLFFKEGGVSHPIYIRKHRESTKEAFSMAYREIFRQAFCLKDGIGVATDNFGCKINFLSFQTLISSGLDKLKVNP